MLMRERFLMFDGTLKERLSMGFKRFESSSRAPRFLHIAIVAAEREYAGARVRMQVGLPGVLLDQSEPMILKKGIHEAHLSPSLINAVPSLP